MAQSGRVRIRVVDTKGAVIATAEASLLGAGGKPLRTAQVNGDGDIVFAGLPVVDCYFSVVAPGFNGKALTVTVHNSDEVKIAAALEVGSVGGPMIVETKPAKMGSTLDAAPEAKRAKCKRWLIFR